MRCLDSDFLVETLRGNIEIKEMKTNIYHEKLFTTSINAYEILYGARTSEKNKENMIEAKKLLSSLSILDFDEKAADVSSKIDVELTRKGLKIDLKDILIASICIANDVPLMTRNTSHFSRISDLKAERW